jgi:hypothetical protein
LKLIFNQYICVQFDRKVLFTPQLHIHEERWPSFFANKYARHQRHD